MNQGVGAVSAAAESRGWGGRGLTEGLGASARASAGPGMGWVELGVWAGTREPAEDSG